jgi:hypothetical protein
MLQKGWSRFDWCLGQSESSVGSLTFVTLLENFLINQQCLEFDSAVPVISRTVYFGFGGLLVELGEMSVNDDVASLISMPKKLIPYLNAVVSVINQCFSGCGKHADIFDPRIWVSKVNFASGVCICILFFVVVANTAAIGEDFVDTGLVEFHDRPAIAVNLYAVASRD